MEDRFSRSGVNAAGWASKCVAVYVAIYMLSPASVVWEWPVQPHSIMVALLACLFCLGRETQQAMRRAASSYLFAVCSAFAGLILIASVASGAFDQVTRALVNYAAFLVCMTVAGLAGASAYIGTWYRTTIILVPWLLISGWSPGDLEAEAGGWANYTTLSYVFGISAAYCAYLASFYAKPIYFAGTAAFALVMVLLGGRGGIIFLGFAFALGSAGKIRLGNAAAVLAASGLVILISLPLLGDDTVDRLTTIVDWSENSGSSNLYRLNMYKAAVAHLTNFPLHGYSPGDTAYLVDLLTGGQYRHFSEGQVVFDADFVWISFRLGLPGVVMYAAILLGVGLAVFRASAEGGRRWAPVIICGAAVVIWSLMDNLLLFQAGWQFLGVVCGLSVRNRSEAVLPSGAGFASDGELLSPPNR